MDDSEPTKLTTRSHGGANQWTPDQILAVTKQAADLIKAAVTHSHTQSGWRQIAEVVMLIAILAAALILGLHGKLNATFAGLLGTILGYFYGRGFGSGSQN